MTWYKYVSTKYDIISPQVPEVLYIPTLEYIQTVKDARYSSEVVDI